MEKTKHPFSSESTKSLSADTVIIGGGVFGLSVGITLLERDPSQSVYILERGILPSGASSRNAGMGTFINYSEFAEEIKLCGKEKALENLKERMNGLFLLFKRLNYDPNIIKKVGCFDIFTAEDISLVNELDLINALIEPVLGKNFFQLRNEKIAEFGMNSNVIKGLVCHFSDWQINTGKALNLMINKFQATGGIYLTGSEVSGFRELESNFSKDNTSKTGSKRIIELRVKSPLDNSQENTWVCKKAIFCLNSFVSKFNKDTKIKPARGQVMLTKPIKSLNFEHNFFADFGFYYMRTVNNRFLLGGARNKDFEGETTNIFETPQFFRNHLQEKLREFFPRLEFEVDMFWSGIMGFEPSDRQIIIERWSENVYSVFGCRGVGMSLSSLAGIKAIEIIFGSNAKI